jgi:hypothetical protein
MVDMGRASTHALLPHHATASIPTCTVMNSPRGVTFKA